MESIPGPATKDFLEEWLNGEAAAVRDDLSAQYCVVYVLPDAAIYVEELYQDFLISSYDTFIYSENPLNQDGLRSLNDRETDEERRVKLSPGYSQEEKQRRLAEIQAARDARKAEREARKTGQEVKQKEREAREVSQQ